MFKKMSLLLLLFVLFCSSPIVGSEIDHHSKRVQFLEQVEDGIVILSAAPHVKRSGDVEYEYRQNSDYFYLTGIEIPDTRVVLRPGAPKEFVLFMPERNRRQMIYEGAIPDLGEAQQMFQADTVYPASEFETKVQQWMRPETRLYHHYSGDHSVEDLIDGFIAKTAIDTVIDAGSIIQAMRLVKSPDEIEMIREAVSITVKAHREMMRVTRPDLYEYQVEAAIEYVFKQSGSSYPGFPSIVASGPNATTLHYIESTRQMLRNELLLVDIGAEYNLYSGDLTRTVPMNGKFHRNQAALYNIVLEALTETTEAVKPGITIRELHQISAKTISEGLLELGILEGDLDAVMENRLYGKFFPHGVSHHLGLDVHDPGQYRESHIHDPLQSGMVITIEPGIYIRPDENVDSRWHNIGIRIEDDILVTDSGHEILSYELPRTVREIENIMKRSPEFVKISP